MDWVALGLAAICVTVLVFRAFVPQSAHDSLHELPRMWGLGIVPFVLILGAIAFLPLLPRTQHWWESNKNRLAVALACAALTIAYVAYFEGAQKVSEVVQHAIVGEYIPFIVLLFSLYVISGGIRLTGDLVAKPLTNTTFLAVGAALASFIGTTGASMLLIRPLLQTNHERRYVLHTVIFFIFLVSNIGGMLLPIGDPPLFLGYLKGVPFFWTFVMTPQWAVACVILLAVYYVWDRRLYAKEDIATKVLDVLDRRPLRFEGKINGLWMLGVILSVALISDDKEFLNTGWTPFTFLREIMMLGFVWLSLVTTRREVREANHFNYHAIFEVAALFIGIFIAMQVPVQVLAVKGAALGLTEPWQFYWATGGLSGFLDNAPTYVVFFETASAMTNEGGEGILPLAGGRFIEEDLLVGISAGAVFFGAMTYIGNGPNFMVKSIAEQSGVRMPSFFGYMVKYSGPILIPLFILIMVLFLFD